LQQPALAPERLRGGGVIDEIQRRPDIFAVLRVLADRKLLLARFECAENPFDAKVLPMSSE
jgi:uncharacterized protein